MKGQTMYTGLGMVLLIGACCLLLGVAQGIAADLGLSSVQIDYNTSGDKTIINGTANKRTSVYQATLFCNGANNLTWKDSTPATLHPTMNFLANSGILLTLNRLCTGF